MIYFDNAATTYPKPECVYSRINEAMIKAFNPGRGSYKVAKEKSKIIEETRQKILKLNNLVNCDVVFTPSATFSMNQIIFGLNLKKGDNVYVTPFEHNAVMRPLEALKNEKGINVYVIPFDKNTFEVKIDELKNMFVTNKPNVVFSTQISNVIGLLVSYNKIFELSKKYKATNVLDASQGYGIVKLVGKDNIDFTVFAGHKSLYAMFGIAGYIVHSDIKLKQIFFGGNGSDSLNLNVTEEYPIGYEFGSQNIVAIESLHESIDWIMNTDIYEHEKELTEYLINKMKTLNNVKLYLPKDESKIFGIVAFNHNNYQSNDVGMILSEDYEICIRTGYHCAPLVHDFIGTRDVGGCCRVSVGYFNNTEEIKKINEKINEL